MGYEWNEDKTCAQIKETGLLAKADVDMQNFRLNVNAQFLHSSFA